MLEKTRNYIEETKQIKTSYKNDIKFIKENKNEDFKKKLKDRKEEYKTKMKELKKPVSFYVLFFICIVIIFGILGSEIYLLKHHRNYENDYFAFRYNEERVFIDDYTEIANMWLISVGGGLYAPSSILIGYTENAKDIEVEYALYAMQERLGGEKSEEESQIKAFSAYDNYVLTLDNNLSYRILSKSIKKDDKILTIMFVNAGDLSEEEQTYLYQVYDTIKLK